MIHKKVRIGRKSQLVLPREARECLHVREGQSVVFEIDGDSVRVVNPRDVLAQSHGAFKNLWGKDREEVDRHIRSQRDSWEDA
jgi:bifunctional DNA-binding transcriptional regulator/antitoxin component of YhaV-PrlF toxin-antitoxin module